MPMSGSGAVPASLYFHIPFCSKKCGYCHFYVVPEEEQKKDQLLQSFKREWQQQLSLLEGREIVSIYFGGGTPSLFGAARIAELLDLIKASFSFPSELELTLEMNPDNLLLQQLKEYKEAGINRASMGVQAFENSLLSTLTRRHSAERAIEAIYNCRESGIENISIDLMYDLPGQTLASWEETLLQAKELPISHLSLYNLTFEPRTSFFKKAQLLKPLLPDCDTSLAMYETARMVLPFAGFQQYEISAFAKSGFHSKHNMGYWQGREFLGFGPSAFSYWNGKRFQNSCNLSRYCRRMEEGKSAIDFEEELSLEAKQRELLTIALRLCSGVDLFLFQQKYGTLPASLLQTLCLLATQGWLTLTSSHVKLTDRGMLFYDTIAAELI